MSIEFGCEEFRSEGEAFFLQKVCNNFVDVPKKTYLLTRTILVHTSTSVCVSDLSKAWLTFLLVVFLWPPQLSSVRRGFI